MLGIWTRRPKMIVNTTVSSSGKQLPGHPDHCLLVTHLKGPPNEEHKKVAELPELFEIEE